MWTVGQPWLSRTRTRYMVSAAGLEVSPLSFLGRAGLASASEASFSGRTLAMTVPALTAVLEGSARRAGAGAAVGAGVLPVVVGEGVDPVAVEEGVEPVVVEAVGGGVS